VLTRSKRFKLHRPHYTDSLKSLQKEFRRRGWHRRATGIILFQFGLVTALAFAGLALVVFSSAVVVMVAGMLLSAMGGLGIATQAHTASHGTVSRAKWLNRFLTYLGYPVLSGLSVTYWRNKHIVLHHKAPNVEGHDDDIRLMPLFALTQEQAQQGGRLARFYYRYVQWLVVLPAIALNAFNTQIYGWAYLLGALGRKESRSAAQWVDLGALTLHLVLFLGLPMLFFPPAQVLLVYVIRFACIGYAMFAAFAPAHFPAEAVIADRSQRRADYALRQTATTVNFRTGPIGRLLCAGVDYQIEHHLFPNHSHVYYPAMSKLVQEFCARHGYPYRTLGWGEGIVKSLLAFAWPKPLVQKLTKKAA
jgi:fatty acid desaturase